MADNTVLSSGSGGDTIATDDVVGGVAGGAKVQRIKAGFGADNSYDDPVGNTGVVGAGTQRVTLATDVDVPGIHAHTRNEAFKESGAIGAEMDETTPVLATEGNVSPARMDANRSIYVQLRSGTAEIGTSGAPVRVDPTGTTTQPISAASLPLPAGAATSAAQLADGHNVTVDNGAGASAVNIQDGGNVISIDAASLPLPTGAATSANQLADGHNVTVDNLASNPVQVAAPNETASGALGALNDAVTISGQGSGTINWEIDTGTLVGTVVFEATLNDTSWFPIDAIRLDGDIKINTAAFPDRGAMTSTGYSQVRLRVSIFTSGTSNARMEKSAGTSVVRVVQEVEYNEDTFHATSDKGVLVLGVRRSADTSPVSTNLDYQTLLFDDLGFLKVNIKDIDATAALAVKGELADSVAASGTNPLLAGNRANQDEPTKNANGDVNYAWGDPWGRTVVILNAPAKFATATHGPLTLTKSTAAIEDLVAAPGAGNSIFVTGLKASNTSATKVRLDVSDGATIRDSAALAADGGGYVMSFNPPWQLAANSALRVALSAAVTDVRINVMFYVSAQ